MIKYFTIEDLLKHYLQKKFHILGEYEEAIENYLKCLSIRKTILQPSHAYTAEISYLLGEAYLKINQIHSAKEHLLLAEKIQASLHKVKALEKTQHLLKECSLS